MRMYLKTACRSAAFRRPSRRPSESLPSEDDFFAPVPKVTSAARLEKSRLELGMSVSVIDRETSLEDAARCALVSMDSTMQSNVTVGPPVEMLIYEKDSLTQKRYMRFDEHHPYYFELRTKWADNIRTAFNTLPPFNWESAGPPPAD